MIGTRWGSLPEIISPDVGGLGDDLEQLVEVAGRIQEIDPAACRARAERYFSHLVMAEEYVRFYRHFIESGQLPEGKAIGP